MNNQSKKDITAANYNLYLGIAEETKLVNLTIEVEKFLTMSKKELFPSSADALVQSHRYGLKKAANLFGTEIRTDLKGFFRGGYAERLRAAGPSGLALYLQLLSEMVAVVP
jgi:hypothetical protein